VHGRIAVLDVYILPFMLAGVALYLRRRPVIAALLIGIGACIKEFCVYALLVILLLEAFRGLQWLWDRRQGRGPQWPSPRRLLRPLATALITAVTALSLLSVLDSAVTPYHNFKPVDRGQSAFCDALPLVHRGCNHIVLMSTYASSLRNHGGPTGIASDPWQFWFDLQPAGYYSLTRPVTVDGKVTYVDTIIDFEGMINPVILATAWPALLLCLWWAVRRRDQISLLVVAWIIATWLPVEIFNVVGSRTTYLYYMVVTMPGIYIAVARLLSLREIPRWVVGLWVGLVLAGFGILFPFKTFSGT
jgi:hypothetical protein